MSVYDLVNFILAAFCDFLSWEGSALVLLSAIAVCVIVPWALGVLKSLFTDHRRKPRPDPDRKK